MNLFDIFQKFPTHETCIQHLERVRFGDDPYCPYCGSIEVGRKDDAGRVGRWNCYGCKSSFNVLAGTIFQKTKVPLQKWFLAIALILDAKKGLSSYQLSRHLNINQKTAWYIAMRIRFAMLSNKELLQGIVEADETYVGGKPRKWNNRNDDKPNKRGRGTSKMPVIGVVQRGGKVIAKPAPRGEVNAKTLTSFLMRHVDPSSLLMTDQYKGYRNIGKKIRHATINHAKQYVDGIVHTNTIEGFWSLLKRSWYGSYHHYTSQWASFYVAESCYKYNIRNNKTQFGAFIQAAIG